MQPLQIKTGLQMSKPAHEVFEAIVDPAKMSQYFISESTGRMEAGAQLMWRWPEFDVSAPIRVSNVAADKYVSFYWDVNGKEHLTEIELTPVDAEATVVSVTEHGSSDGEAGIAWLKGNTEGWANFLACMKAYLEYGINLRTGGFDYRKPEFQKAKAAQ